MKKRTLDPNAVRLFLLGGSFFGMLFAMFTKNWLAFIFAMVALVVLAFPGLTKEAPEKNKVEGNKEQG